MEDGVTNSCGIARAPCWLPATGPKCAPPRPALPPLACSWGCCLDFPACPLPALPPTLTLHHASVLRLTHWVQVPEGGRARASVPGTV